MLCRFLFVIQFYIANGFYVAIDYHAGQGQIETDRQVVSDPALFQENWVGLLRAIQSLPTYADNIRGGGLSLLLLKSIMSPLLNERPKHAAHWLLVLPSLSAISQLGFLICMSCMSNVIHCRRPSLL